MNILTELKTIDIDVNYKNDRESINKFILFYNENDEHTYLEQIREHKPTIQVNLDDLALFDDSGIVKRLESNAFTYLDLFYKVIDDILFTEGDYLIGDNEEDIFFYHRISRFKEKFPDKNVSDFLPSFLLRNYYINLVPRNNSKILSARQLKSEQIGSLIRVSGVVTKISQVKPNVKVATYICESCGSEIYQQVSGDVFDLLEECNSEKCKLKKVKGTLILVTRGSKFLKYQSLQIQELTNDVPHGCIPRIINVECYGTTTEKCLPGDIVVIGGIFLPKPYYGIKKLKAGLLTDTYVLATHVKTTKSENVVQLESRSFDIKTLVRNIAPEIYGMDDVKKILLLMLVGAPTKVKKDGMKIRGDINVLLLGDPGIAKSQLLKTVVKISKRGIYTTGRGSSGVGLTASVSKDPITNEVILEGGALVLSDMGICCIDELDKMGELDRVSIHEVMEQQSVSISKAGINTTLNARCAVLGAANPVKGRYDCRQSVEHNVGLPCSLLSRFDILVVLRDEADEARDKALAEHVTSLHFDEEIESENVNYHEIRNYIAQCKTFDPSIPNELSKKLLNSYVKARYENEYTTPRYLLSLIRLCLAHARLRQSNTVSQEDADEVLRLMEVTRIPSLKKKNENTYNKRKIFELVLSLIYKTEDGHSYVRLEDVWKATSSLYTRDEVEDVIGSFCSTGTWVRNNYDIIILQ